MLLNEVKINYNANRQKNTTIKSCYLFKYYEINIIFCVIIFFCKCSSTAQIAINNILCTGMHVKLYELNTILIIHNRISMCGELARC